MVNFQPTGGRILVRHIPHRQGVIDTSAHDEKAGGEMILAEGVIMAVGPGEYEDGVFVPTTVKPGQRVIFNARWNDFASGELVGTDCDGKGPLERPAPQWQWMAPPGVSTKPTKDMHLITEGDIAGVLA